MKSFFYSQLNEELLLEKKMSDQYKKELESVVTAGYAEEQGSVYDKIVKADPTAQGLPGQESGDYINWIAKTFLESAKAHKFYGFDIVARSLKRFEVYKQWWRRNKAIVDAERKDPVHADASYIKDNPPSFDIYTIKSINQLPAHVETIYDYIKRFGYDETTKEQKAKAEAIKKDPKHSDVIFENNEFAFVNTKSHKSNQSWGINTKWCTTDKSGSYFDRYINLDDLYVLLDKKNNRRYQFHFPTDQHMDEKDNEIPQDKLKELFSRLPIELKQKIKQTADKGSKAIDTISMVYDDVEAEKNDLENDKHELGIEVDELEKEFDKIKNEIEKKKEEYEETGDEKIETEIGDLEQELGEKEDELNNKQKEFNKCDDAISSLEDGEFEYEGEMYEPSEIDFSKSGLRRFMNCLDVDTEGFNW